MERKDVKEAIAGNTAMGKLFKFFEDEMNKLKTENGKRTEEIAKLTGTISEMKKELETKDTLMQHAANLVFKTNEYINGVLLLIANAKDFDGTDFSCDVCNASPPEVDMKKVMTTVPSEMLDNIEEYYHTLSKKGIMPKKNLKEGVEYLKELVLYDKSLWGICEPCFNSIFKGKSTNLIKLRSQPFYILYERSKLPKKPKTSDQKPNPNPEELAKQQKLNTETYYMHRDTIINAITDAMNEFKDNSETKEQLKKAISYELTKF